MPRRGDRKKGQPAHMNNFAFKHNKNSKKTTVIAAAPTHGLCRRCKDKVEWRKKYRKYKPLSQPHQCLVCTQRTVVLAYRTICDACARKAHECSKCRINLSAPQALLPSAGGADSDDEEGSAAPVVDERQEKMAHLMGLYDDVDTPLTELELDNALGYLDVRVGERDRRRLHRLFDQGRIRTLRELVALAHGGKSAAKAHVRKGDEEAAARRAARAAANGEAGEDEEDDDDGDDEGDDDLEEDEAVEEKTAEDLAAEAADEGDSADEGDEEEEDEQEQ